MNEKEKIRAELVRLKRELTASKIVTPFEEGRISAFEDMILFIDSMSASTLDKTFGTITKTS